MSSKVKDGLFLGDLDAAQDAEFLQLNGIAHVVNCAPRQVPPLFQQALGLNYVACDLDEVLGRQLFDLDNREFRALVQLMDRALERTESVLVHSLHGRNRAPSVVMGYLMVRYCWGVDKAFEFVAAKRPDVQPHESYVEQLCGLEAQLQRQRPQRATEAQLFDWRPALADPGSDELVLIHTFLNAAGRTPGVEATAAPPPLRARNASSRRLTWIDQSHQHKKLYPTLLIRPERPPNHSYNDMAPANGWVDLIAPSGVGPDAPSAKATGPSHDGADAGTEAPRRSRFHSFSVPQRRQHADAPSPVTSPAPPTDREDPELAIEVASVTSSTLMGRSQQRQGPPPRHTTSAARQQRQPPPTSSFASSSSGRAGSFRNSSSTTTTTTTATASGNGNGNGHGPSKPTTARVRSHEPSRATTPRAAVKTASSGTRALQGLGAATALAFAPARGHAFRAVEGLARAAAIFPLGATRAFAEPETTRAPPPRPRTAPPRLRKRDTDDVSSGLSLSRVTLEAPAATIKFGPPPVSATTRRMSAATLDLGVGPAPSASAGGSSYRAHKLTGRSATAPPVRPKTARAIWK